MTESRGFVVDTLIGRVRAKAPDVDLASVDVLVYGFESKRMSGPALEGFGWTLDQMTDEDLRDVGPGQFLLRATVPGVAGAQQMPFKNPERAETEAVPVLEPVTPRAEVPMLQVQPQQSSDSVMVALIQSQSAMTLGMMNAQQAASDRQMKMMMDMQNGQKSSTLGDLKEMATFLGKNLKGGDSDGGFDLAGIATLVGEVIAKMPAPAPAPAPQPEVMRPELRLTPGQVDATRVPAARADGTPVPPVAGTPEPLPDPEPVPEGLDAALVPVGAFLRSLQGREEIDFASAGAALVNMLDAVCEEGQLEMLFAVEPEAAARAIVDRFPDVDLVLAIAVCREAISSIQPDAADAADDDAGGEKGAGDEAGD